MIFGSRYMRVLSIGALLLAMGVVSSPGSAATSSPAFIRGAAGRAHVLPPWSNPYGRSYGEWVAAWWQWAAGTPATHNPGLDPTGKDCAVGQKGPVWFLAGSFTSGQTVKRTECRIPAGTALFFPIANESWLSNPDLPGCAPADPWYGATPADRVRWALFERVILHNPRHIWAPNRRDRLSFSVDGWYVPGLHALYARSPVFRSDLPEDNIFDVLCGVPVRAFRSTHDVAWGYHVFLAPLPPGRHRLRWTADVVGGSNPGRSIGRIEQNVTYDLVVAPKLAVPAR